MVTGAAAPFWALAWLCGAAARLSARPSACPVVGAASSAPSRCPQALPGWAQESVFTNTIHTAPGAPRLCPEDVRPRAPGGGPGARLSAQGKPARPAGCCSGLPVQRSCRHLGGRRPQGGLPPLPLPGMPHGNLLTWPPSHSIPAESYSTYPRAPPQDPGNIKVQSTRRHSEELQREWLVGHLSPVKLE